MPYASKEDANPALRGIKPPLTLAQMNLVAEWADRIAESDDPPDSPWAVAISNFKKTHTVQDGRWVKKQSSNLMHNRAVAADHRRETMQDRDYLVIPVVAVREGVLNGEFVSSAEIARSVEGWNGRPVVVDHPQDEQGMDISANAPGVLSRYQVGQMFNTRYEDGALKGEIWLDVVLARGSKQGSEVLRRFEQGIPTDVSTAYFRKLEADEGEHDGRAYSGRAVNLMPDHLALLLDDAGACSWQDGCGAPRTNADESLESQIEEIRRVWVAEYESKDVPARVEPWVTEIFKDYLVIEAAGRHWRVSYSIEDGKPAFAGREKWVRVEEKREWIPVQEDEMQNKESGMELSENAMQKVVKAIIRALSTHKEKDMTKIAELMERGVPFDQDALEAMSDEQVDFLARQAASPEETPAANEGEDEGRNDAPDFAAALDEMFADLGGVAGVKEKLAEVKANKDKERGDLVSALVANAKCALTEEQLGALDVATLRGIEQSLVDPDYRGGGGGREAATNQDDVVPFVAPPVLLKQKEAQNG